MIKVDDPAFAQYQYNLIVEKLESTIYLLVNSPGDERIKRLLEAYLKFLKNTKVETH